MTYITVCCGYAYKVEEFCFTYAEDEFKPINEQLRELQTAAYNHGLSLSEVLTRHGRREFVLMSAEKYDWLRASAQRAIARTTQPMW